MTIIKINTNIRMKSNNILMESYRRKTLKREESLSSMSNVFKQAPLLIKDPADLYPRISSLAKKKEKSLKSRTRTGVQAKLWNKSASCGKKCLMMRNRSSKNYLKKIEIGMILKEKSLPTRKKKKELSIKTITSSRPSETELRYWRMRSRRESNLKTSWINNNWKATKTRDKGRNRRKLCNS